MSFVDGYCGGGLYRFGQQNLPGSPLIILEAVAEMEAILSASRPKGFHIKSNYIFVDECKYHTEFLRSEIESSQFKKMLYKEIVIITDDFNAILPDIILKVKDVSPQAGRALFLLDQFGWSQVAFRSIRSILSELKSSEVFLTFSVDSLINYLSENKFDMKAFGEIDVDVALVKELVKFKEDERLGYRMLIQNSLYGHIQKMTDALYYSPFFIKSIEAHRSYWFLHLSQHREARNVIGEIHWSENNTTTHHGGLGLNALGFTPGKGIDQFTMDYVFDEHAKALSMAAIKEQLPPLIYDAVRSDKLPTVEDIFRLRCNDTPLIRSHIEEGVVALRDEREVIIINKEGRVRPRTTKLDWDDRIKLAKSPTLFGPFWRFGKKPIE